MNIVSKYSKYLDEAFELYDSQTDKSVVKVAEILHKKYNPKINIQTFRSGLNRQMVLSGKKLVRTPKSKRKETKKKTEAQPFVLSAWNFKTGEMMDIKEYCEFYKLPYDDIHSYKLVSHTGTPFFNILFKENKLDLKDLTPEFIEAAIKKHIQPVKLPKYNGGISKNCLRIIYTDTHIAMETNNNGFSLYGGIWNEEELFIRKNTMITDIRESFELFGYFDEIHVIELGDFMDGFNAETVRGGHELPQNMDNEKAFDVGLSFKIELIKAIVKLNITTKIRSFNICNDNHAGSFGYVVNSAAKQFLEAMYTGLVEVVNLRKFINHYFYGKHCFILSHGKDATNKKFGFKPQLDPKAKETIEGYIDNNNITKYSDFITFEKGDSHLQLFDYANSDKFDYLNYMALSPASEWIQTNFKRGRSGYNLMIVTKDKKRKIMLPTEFKWSNNNLNTNKLSS